MVKSLEFMKSDLNTVSKWKWSAIYTCLQKRRNPIVYCLPDKQQVPYKILDLKQHRHNTLNESNIEPSATDECD